MAARRLVVPAAARRERLDRWLAGTLPDVSRAHVQALIAEGRVSVDGAPRKAAYRLRGGEAIDVDLPPPAPAALAPEPLGLAIVYEDEHLLVVDKPAGMVVHPGAGRSTGTLAAAVLAHAPGTAGVGGPRRPGIVHRLDKGTSGLLVIAKTQPAYEALTGQLAARAVGRKYVAVVHGRVARAAGVIEACIGRDPRDRRRMAVRPAGLGKRAVTRYRVLERLGDFTLLELTLETGRTHQIRVHMASRGHPVVGDDTYGPRRRQPPVPLEGLALHAAQLRLVHPVTQKLMEFSAPLPERLERLLGYLREQPR